MQLPNEMEAALTVDERELILKALSYYQVHLFDELRKVQNDSLEADYRKTTLVIKKVHKMME